MRHGFRRWLISTTALASMVLVSDTARAQFIGPMTRIDRGVIVDGLGRGDRMIGNVCVKAVDVARYQPLGP
jgi:hypothetical protein